MQLRKKLTGSLIICLLLLPPSFLYSQETAAPQNPPAKKTMSKPLQLLIGEGLIVLNSAMAATAPEIMGGAMILVSPLGASEKSSATANLIGVFSFASLGVYNLIVPEDENYEWDETFAANMILWHGLAGILVACDHFFPLEETPKPEQQVFLFGMEKGMGVAYRKKF